MSGSPTPAPRRSTLGHALKAVAWSFFGIRAGREYQKDVERLHPVHVIIAGLAAAALFIGGIVLLVRWVVVSGVAG